jgi:hypothetical protein
MKRILFSFIRDLELCGERGNSPQFGIASEDEKQLMTGFLSRLVEDLD